MIGLLLTIPSEIAEPSLAYFGLSKEEDIKVIKECVYSYGKILLAHFFNVVALEDVPKKVRINSLIDFNSYLENSIGEDDDLHKWTFALLHTIERSEKIHGPITGRALLKNL